MKTMKKLQVAVAAASLFAVTGGALAASISQSGLTIAREVISANTAATQNLRAPTVTFNYDNGPTANATSTQDFNVTLTLGGDGDAKWGAQLATYKTVAAVRRNNGNLVVAVLPLADLNAVPAGKVAIVLMSVDVVPGASEKTYRYKFRLVNNTATSFGIGDLQLSFNGQNPGDGAAAPYDTGLASVTAVGVAAAADYGLIKNLAASANATTVNAGAGVTGDTDGGCGEGIRKITVTARNYIGSGDGVEGESQGAPANSITNNGYVQFQTGLRVQLTKGVAVDRNTDPLFGNNQFTTNGAAATTDQMSIGELKFSNRLVDAWDISQQTNYYKLGANDLDNVPSEKNGDVDVADASALRLALNATNGFVAGAKFGLSTTPTCAGAVYNAATLSNGNKDAVVTFSRGYLANAAAYGAASITDTDAATGAVGAPFNIAGPGTQDRAYVCMQVPGNALIPQSRFEGTAELLKADTDPDVSGDEQSNISCKAPLAGLGGGIKIDVRNYMEFPAGSEWESYVRVINNSETVTADVFAQYIRADGTYGKWVKLFDLPARGARFISGTEIAAAMAATGANSSAGGADQGYNNNVAAAYAGSNARLRISSEAASTLRVQNYIYNSTTKLLSEMSGAQGADFVNVEASSRDHIDQDAQTGIKK